MERVYDDCKHCNKHRVVYDLLELAGFVEYLREGNRITKFTGMGANIDQMTISRAQSLARRIMWTIESERTLK